MTIELAMLALSIVLGLVHVILNASTATRAYGLDWNTARATRRCRHWSGWRAGCSGRCIISSRRLRFSPPRCWPRMPLNRHNALTHIGVQLYFWGRVAYLPLYAYGVPKARSAAWGVATLGIVLILIALI